MVRPDKGTDYSRLFSSGYYSKSDEKDILARCLTNYFKNETFDNALDVGPGDGRITKLISERSRHLTAVEIEEGYRRSFRQNFPDSRLIEQGIQNVEFPKNSFDLILASHVLYYLPVGDWHRVLNNFYKWKKTTGKLVCILNTPDCEWWEFSNELSSRLKTALGFAYTDARIFFQTVCGGASEFIEYDSRVVWHSDRKGLIEFLIGIFLALPLEIIDERTSKIVNSFIDEHISNDGSFSIGERAVIAIWK